MDRPAGLFGSRGGRAAARLLLAANLVLLGVAWLASLVAYGQLPGKIASWSSVWAGRVVEVERSRSFFLNPILQTLFFGAYLAMAKALTTRPLKTASQGPALDGDRADRLKNLKTEVLYLALIFFDLIFIHLQTSRILLSRGIGAGLIRPYVAGLLLMILFVLFPYYRIRRRMILTDSGGYPGPR